MRRLAAVAATLALSLTACTGGGSGKDDNKNEDAGLSSRLPAKAPSTRGPVTGPALEPKVVLEASDELDELDTSTDVKSQVQRRSGAFISGRTVVGYSIDNISGYDLDSGKDLWTSDLDLGSGAVCFVSRPDRAVKTFTVAYGELGYCPELATIRVSDGKVVSKSTTLSDGVQFRGEKVGGTVTDMFTLNGRDYLVDLDGTVWKMTKGAPEPFTRLEAASYVDLYPTPKGDVLIGTRRHAGLCSVDAYALPSFKHLWTKDSAALFPEASDECSISAPPRNPALLAQQSGVKDYLVEVEPATGEVIARASASRDSASPTPQGEFDLSSATLELDQALGLPGGDTVFAQVQGLTRYSPRTGKVVWDLDLSQLEIEVSAERARTKVQPQGITSDGYLLASVSNHMAAEIVAIEAKTGKLVGRWAVPPEYRNGFQVDPGMTLFDGGVVLTRNFDAWRLAFLKGLGVPEPEGDRYDIGVFAFPKPDNSATSAVPAAGPTDTDAKPLGGIKTPAGASEDDRGVGAFDAGSLLIAYAGNTLTGLSPKSGKPAWSIEGDAELGAKVCAVPEPDRDVKAFLIAYYSSDGECTKLRRVSVSDGTVTDRVDLPVDTSVSNIEVHEGVMYVITTNAAVSRFEDGALVPHGALAHAPYQLERTPQDPSLLVSTAKLEDGRDWAVEAYRLPSFAPVWSTTAKAMFSKVDRNNSVDAWRGNGLWVSTSYGDYESAAKMQDSLVQLDPATGAVVARTGTVERDLLADDLTTFSMSGVATATDDTVGLDNGDVVLPQNTGIMRYSLAGNTIRWAVDTASIMQSMEKDQAATAVTQHYDLINRGKTILVTLSNDVSAELMTLKAADGTITGRWNVPAASRNGLQTSPTVTPFSGGVALSHESYSWASAFRQPGRAVPAEQRYDVGLFAMPKPKG